MKTSAHGSKQGEKNSVTFEPCSCIRYGKTWSEEFRHICTTSYDDGEEKKLELGRDKSITGISSGDDDGNT